MTKNPKNPHFSTPLRQNFAFRSWIVGCGGFVRRQARENQRPCRKDQETRTLTEALQKNSPEIACMQPAKATQKLKAVVQNLAYPKSAGLYRKQNRHCTLPLLLYVTCRSPIFCQWPVATSFAHVPDASPMVHLSRTAATGCHLWLSADRSKGRAQGDLPKAA